MNRPDVGAALHWTITSANEELPCIRAARRKAYVEPATKPSVAPNTKARSLSLFASTLAVVGARARSKISLAVALHASV